MKDAGSLEETVRTEMSRCHGAVTIEVVTNEVDSLERRDMSKLPDGGAWEPDTVGESAVGYQESTGRN